MIFSSRSRSILAAYGWGGDLAKIARRSNAACSPPTATRSPTRCPPKPCSPCPNSTACCRCPTRPCTLPPEARGGDAVPDHRSLREEREQFLKEPETRRLKSRGHLARNRKFESISLQERDGMGQAARKWHHRRCSQLMECPDAPAERLEQVPRRPGPR